MPHQVLKSTTVGSVGDLAKIAQALAGINVNIVAVGGGEGMHGAQEVGVIAMLVEPDDDAKMREIDQTLRTLVLDPGPPPRKIAHLETHPSIHVELEDTPGQLQYAASNVAGKNILSVISIDNRDGVAHVALGFSRSDVSAAQAALDAAGVKIVPAD
jgi:hypothetical protein